MILGALDRPRRLWRVVDRNCNYSSFNGRHWTPSRYSAIVCLRCGRYWRTAASYVLDLWDRAEDEINIGPGYPGYREAMKRFGRTPHR